MKKRIKTLEEEIEILRIEVDMYSQEYDGIDRSVRYDQGLNHPQL